MAHRMSIVHSDTIHGAGLFTCWPYGVDYETELHSESATAYGLRQLSKHDIDAAESAGEIALASNLRNNSIYIYSANQDTDTPPVGQEALKMVYESYGTTKLHLVQEDAEHYFGPGKMEPGLR